MEVVVASLFGGDGFVFSAWLGFSVRLLVVLLLAIWLLWFMVLIVTCRERERERENQGHESMESHEYGNITG
uniref:Uncharacterized protein n=1 Tax=Nelumbo nucifera TaxID=4432 RepID=A0A822Y6Q7_NELNU|nr:TPA_asm: hypothetical protein HUJ06_029658 [Nelumbo nucifera]